MPRWAASELVSASLTGDSVAAELLAAIWPGCFRLAATVIGDSGRAQDAAQETCVIVTERYELCVLPVLSIRGSTGSSCVSQRAFDAEMT